MAHIIITFYPNGQIDSLLQDKPPKLKQLQELVGGYIQEVPYFKTYTTPSGDKYTRGVAYADEDGLMKGLHTNFQAIRAWQNACPNGDLYRMQLVGKVVFVAKAKEQIVMRAAK